MPLDALEDEPDGRSGEQTFKKVRKKVLAALRGLNIYYHDGVLVREFSLRLDRLGASLRLRARVPLPPGFPEITPANAAVYVRELETWLTARSLKEQATQVFGALLDLRLAQVCERSEALAVFFLQQLKAALDGALSVEQLTVLLDRVGARWLDRVDTMERASSLEKALGLDAYPSIFGLARSFGRRHTLFIGPTNSGKTYQALERLAAAESGLYLGPLRLLALEAQEALLGRGVNTSLLTGEERDLREGARHVASTVEMCNFGQRLGCAVIDEIQMLADPDRGWAWTAAISGVPADEVVLVGSYEGYALVKPLLQRLGEPFDVVELERKNPLHLMDRCLGLQDVEKGDALIAFSRRDVLAWRDELLKRGRSVSVVYGALSPEVRRAQAERFASGEAEVLVATDAIGMGLNLPIARVLFTDHIKWNGVSEEALEAVAVRQIGGRAGRFGHHEEGRVGALFSDTLAHLRDVMEEPAQLPERLAVAPSAAHLSAIAQGIRTDSLPKAIRFFTDNFIASDPLFRAADLEDAHELAVIFERRAADLPLEVRYAYACAPIDRKTESMVGQVRIWAGEHAAGRSVDCPQAPGYLRARPDLRWLAEAEFEQKLLNCYCWLAYRHPGVYHGLEAALELRRELSYYIDRVLLTRHRHGDLKTSRMYRENWSRRRGE